MNATEYTSRVPRREKDPPTPQGKWIRLVRKAARLTQPAFAARIKVDRVTVSKWENGSYIPEWGSIEKVLRAFPDAQQPPFAPGSGRTTVSTTQAERPRVSGKYSSLLNALEEWAQKAGEVPPDAQFAQGLLTLYEEFRKRLSESTSSPASD